MATNPYEPPKSEVADVVRGGAAPPLWNPNAAASWSLLFSPAFGAYLHMKNWQALGDDGKAAAQKTWFIVTLFFVVCLAVVSGFLPDSKAIDSLSRFVPLALLLSWYFSSAKPQAALVKARFGTQYPRRGWGKPLLIAIAVLVVVMVATVAIVLATATVPNPT